MSDRTSGSRAPQPPKATTASIAPARFAAAQVLLAIERGTAHSDDQLRSPRVETLSREDRNLVTEMVMGTLRWQRVLDDEIAARLRDPGAEMHYGVIIALRLGAYQLIFLDRIPSYAAVTESVELARKADGDGAAGFVNAVLRRMTREQIAQKSGVRDAVRAHPEWMVDRWLARFGDVGTAKLCEWNQKPSAPALRVAASAEAALREHVELAPGAFLVEARSVVGGEVPQNAEFAAGRVRFQDEASQLVGELASLFWEDAPSPQKVLDACAAPGGKTMILAERLPEAEITAMDVSGARLRLTERRFSWPSNVTFVIDDAAALPPEKINDLALIDAPCSGTGTLGRNPEIRHRLELEEFTRQAERQRGILDAVLRTMRPGARVVYSTCSLEAEENEQVVEAVLAKHPNVEVVPVTGELARLFAAGRLTEPGYRSLRDTAVSGRYLRTLPGMHACDGFFAAVLKVR